MVGNFLKTTILNLISQEERTTITPLSAAQQVVIVRDDAGRIMATGDGIPFAFNRQAVDRYRELLQENPGAPSVVCTDYRVIDEKAFASIVEAVGR